MEELRWNTVRVFRKCEEKNMKKKPCFNNEVEVEYPSETWHATINSYNPTICKHTVAKTLTYT
jgi:hypothetical protein